MKKRLLSLAMALVMCLSLLPAAAFASGSKQVELVDVRFDLPQAGQHPTMDLSPDAKGCSVILKAWEDVTDSRHPRVMTEEDVFEAGGVYQLTYKVQVLEGYYMDESTERQFPAGGWPEEIVRDEWCTHYLSRFSVPAHPGDVAVNEANFPDDGLRSYLLEKVGVAKDGVLTAAELRRVQRLRPTEGTVKDLTGIAYFHNLRYLEMNDQKLTKVDLRGNPILREVHLENNRLTSLDLRANPWVEEVRCEDNRLTTLRVTGCGRLETLDADNNQLTSLTLDDNYRLRRLFCADNQLEKLRLRHLTDLETLRCSDNRLKKLELDYLPYLRDLRCSNAQLDALDISRNQYLERVILNTDPPKKEITYTAAPKGVSFEMVGAKTEKDIRDLTGGYIGSDSVRLRYDSQEARFRVGETRYVVRQAETMPGDQYTFLSYRSDWHMDSSYQGGSYLVADEQGVITQAFPYRFEKETLYGSLADGFDLWNHAGEVGFVGHFDCGDTVELRGGGDYEAELCWENQLPAPQLTVTVLEDTGKPWLEWSLVDGACGYEVEVSENGKAYDTLYTSRGNHLRHGSAKPGVTYSYRVRAVECSDDLPGRWSRDAQVVCPCNAPFVLLDTRIDGKPVVTWGDVKGAGKYQVLCAIGDGEMEVLKTVGGNKLTHGSAAYGERYTYQVRALGKDGNGEGRLSEPVSVKVRKPARPLDTPELTITNKRTTGKPYLTWDAVQGAEKYEVYRAAGKYGEFTRLWSGSGTHLTHGSAQSARTYYYRVRAVDEDGVRGPFSPVTLRTCDLPQPDVKVTTRSDGKPVLRWQRVEGANFYEVFYRVDGGQFQRLITAESPKVTHGSAKRGHTYTYKVRALPDKTAAISAWSYYDTIRVK